MSRCNRLARSGSLQFACSTSPQLSLNPDIVCHAYSLRSARVSADSNQNCCRWSSSELWTPSTRAGVCHVVVRLRSRAALQHKFRSLSLPCSVALKSSLPLKLHRVWRAGGHQSHHSAHASAGWCGSCSNTHVAVPHQLNKLNLRCAAPRCQQRYLLGTPGPASSNHSWSRVLPELSAVPLSGCRPLSRPASSLSRRSSAP